MSEHSGDVAAYVKVFLALMVLTAITVAAAFVDMGRWNDAVALGIAVLKATLVVLIFMHLLRASRLTRVFAGASILWLVIFFALTFADYAARGWMEIYGG